MSDPYVTQTPLSVHEVLEATPDFRGIILDKREDSTIVPAWGVMDGRSELLGFFDHEDTRFAEVVHEAAKGWGL